MDSEKPNVLWRFALPAAIVLLAATVAVALIATKPEVEKRAIEAPVPVVRVERVELTDEHLVVESQGTVSPRTESRLVPEVAGKVLWISDSFVSGGFFEKGETLVRIDPFDYRQALVTARAELARAELRLAQEEAEGRVARREWEELGRGGGNGSPLALREPQLADARASLEAARAAVERAERNLARTEMKAPYAGRVREKSVDVGQFVTVGSPIATIYSVEAAEIRLPLPDDELRFVELPLSYRGAGTSGPRPKVVLSTVFAGKRYEWEGRIVRTEGEIDPRTRMVHAVAEVRDPYAAAKDEPERPPLNAGMFVHAAIEGLTAEGVAVLPRAGLRASDRVWVVDREGRLRYRAVTVLRTTEQQVLVSAGLEEGELVCVSPLDVTTDGMRVRVEGEEKSL